MNLCIEIHPIVVELFESEPKLWTDRLKLPCSYRSEIEKESM